MTKRQLFDQLKHFADDCEIKVYDIDYCDKNGQPIRPIKKIEVVDDKLILLE